jgi:DNA-binding MarR family transcriptional regulator
MTDARYGFELPLLLVGAFRSIIDQLHARLAEHGHPAARPIHGFALQAIGADGATVSELGRRLAVSKQAAAKTAAGLEQLGYVVREAHPTDARAVRLRRSPRGEEFLALSAAIFEEIHAEWSQTLGDERLGALEHDLELIAGRTQLGNTPGWIA